MYDVFNGFYADTADENAVVSISGGNDGLEDGESLAVLSDTIYNSVDNTVVYGTSGDDSIVNIAQNITIDAGNGENYIENYKSNVTITSGDDDDNITNVYTVGYSTKNIFINASNGNNTVTNGDTIITGTGNDSIINSRGENIFINSGDGNDSIILLTDHYDSQNVSVISGTGNDTIKNYLGMSDSTYISMGSGNDFIDFSSDYSSKNISYANGDGNDTVVGFGVYGDDTLNISGDYTTIESGNDIIVKVGTGSIVLQSAKNETFTINDSYSTSKEDYNILQPTNNTYTYSTGNAIITNYVSEEVINYQTDFTGLGFNSTDFMVNSSSGTLTIQNVRDKLMNFAINGNLAARAFMSSGGGEVNGSGFSELTAFIGGNDASNVITAGSGDSSLWGGSGGVDNLIGGTGQDNFFFGKYDGLDVISNASSSDKVHLYDVNLSDIISANVSDGVISANFNTGGTLQINCTENLSPTFQLADSSWQYNHSNNAWIQK